MTISSLARPLPPTDSRPRFIVTSTSAEYFAVCARARTGEILVYAWDSLATKSGKDNGAWRFEVGYPNIQDQQPT